jgi:glycerol-3-phosphate acyltransferase PlsY
MPSEHIVPYLVALIGGYLLGSIPFGVLITRAGGMGDVRQIGSGNIGATNVLRTGRKDLAALTLLGDGGKGIVAVLIARYAGHALFPNDAILVDALTAVAGGAAFLGHLFPVWLGFKGGKGVATFFGVLLVACWPAGVLAVLTWIAMALVFRISSLAALMAAALSPLFVMATDTPHPYFPLAVVMALLIFIRHRANIARLLKGQEPRIGAGKEAAATPQ